MTTDAERVRIAAHREAYADDPAMAERHKTRFISIRGQTKAGEPMTTRMVPLHAWNLATSSERIKLWDEARPSTFTEVGDRLFTKSDAEAFHAYRAALTEIANGGGTYGSQALEYKNIARKALGMELLP